MRVGIEGGVKKTGGEEILNGVPRQQQFPVLLHDLMVDPHLRRLGEDLDGVPQQAGGSRAEGVGAETRGEDYSAGVRSVRMRQLPQDLDTAVVGVFEALDDLFLHGPRCIKKALLARGCAGNENILGKIGDHGGHIRMHHLPLEGRQVDAERRSVTAISGHDCRVAGEQDRRGSQTNGPGAVAQPCPTGLAETGTAASETRGSGDRGDIDGQSGSPGQGVHSLLPVTAGRLPAPACCRSRHRQVAGEGIGVLLECVGALVISDSQILEKDRDAGGISDEEVNVHVEPLFAVGQESQFQLQVLSHRDVEYAVGYRCAHSLEFILDTIPSVGQVVDGNGAGGD